MLQLANKFLHLLLCLAGECSGACEELWCCVLDGSEDLGFALDLIWSSSPFLISVGVSTVGFSGGSNGRYACQLAEKSGWILSPTSFSGFVTDEGPD
jgi:hypothetical protein